MKFAFASVVSIKDIKKGEKFSLKNLWVKRPGTGFYLAKDFKKILGKKAVNNIKKNKLKGDVKLDKSLYIFRQSSREVFCRQLLKA